MKQEVPGRNHSALSLHPCNAITLMADWYNLGFFLTTPNSSDEIIQFADFCKYCAEGFYWHYAALEHQGLCRKGWVRFRSPR